MVDSSVRTYGYREQRQATPKGNGQGRVYFSIYLSRSDYEALRTFCQERDISLSMAGRAGLSLLMRKQ